jgi:hypothetical protein
MPYVDKESRLKMRATLEAFHYAIDFYGVTPGELNYVITCLANDYINTKGENYTHMNDVLGVLEGAKLELYRQRVAPYENKKMEENGNVY